MARVGLKSNQKRYLKTQRENGCRCMVVCVYVQVQGEKPAIVKVQSERKLKRVNCLLRKKGSSNSASDKES